MYHRRFERCRLSSFCHVEAISVDIQDALRFSRPVIVLTAFACLISMIQWYCAQRSNEPAVSLHVDGHVIYSPFTSGNSDSLFRDEAADLFGGAPGSSGHTRIIVPPHFNPPHLALFRRSSNSFVTIIQATGWRCPVAPGVHPWVACIDS